MSDVSLGGKRLRPCENSAEYERNASSNSLGAINIMDWRWQTRGKRDTYAPSSTNTVFQYWRMLLTDVLFSSGNYAGGGYRNHPLSMYELYSSKTKDTKAEKVYSKSELFTNLINSASNEEQKAMRNIVKKMQGSCSMPAIRLLGWFLGKLWRTVFNSIEVTNIKQMKESFSDAAKEGKAAVYVPTHKSHVDYLLLSYILFGFNMPVCMTTNIILEANESIVTFIVRCLTSRQAKI